MSEYEFRQLVASMRSHQRNPGEADPQLVAMLERRVDVELQLYFEPKLFE